MNQLSNTLSTLWLPCAAHTIQLCVNTSLSETNAADMIVAKCHDLAVMLRNSGLFRRHMDIVQQQQYPESQPLTFSIDMPTRWNSQYMMMERVIKLADAIRMARQNIVQSDYTPEARRQVRKLDTMMLEEDDLQVVKDLVTVLKPMYIFTMQVGSGKIPAVSLLYPWVYDEVNNLGDAVNAIESAAAVNLRTRLVDHIRVRWPLDRIPDAVAIATFLNPGLKKHPLFDMQIERNGQNVKLLDNVHRLVVTELLDLLKDRESTLATFYNGQCHEQDSSDDDAPITQPGSPLLRNITRELQDYTAYSIEKLERRLKYRDDPLAWWLKHSTSYRYLGYLARRYLAIQPSSVPSERLFSDAGNLVTKKRSNLDDTTIENMLFIRRFLSNGPNK